MDYLTELVMVAGINTIVALGLYVQMSTGQLSAGQAAFMGIGSYTAGYLSARMGMPYVVTLAIGGIVAGVVAAAFAALILRLSHWFLAVASLAFGEAMVVVLLNVDVLGGAIGFFGVPLRTNVYWILGVLVVVVLALTRFQGSRFGYAFQAVNQDEQVASALGINVRATRVAAFGVGGFLAGLGGALFVQLNGLVLPTDLGFSRSLPFLLYVAIGGTYSFWGTILGTVLLALLPEVLRFSLYDRFLFYGIAMIGVMILRPQGLISGPLRLGWVRTRLLGLRRGRGKG
jgi:branched-chain amino acid transport system permease protein